MKNIFLIILAIIISSEAIIFSQNHSQLTTHNSQIISNPLILNEKKVHFQNTKWNFFYSHLNGHRFTILNYKISLDIYNCFLSPYPTSYKGTVTIQAIVDSTLDSIALNAYNYSLVIDSVALSGASFTHSNDILTIQLDRTYNQGETFYVQINYHHLNVFDGAFYASNGFVVTDCEPERARNWFPCLDRPSDKASLDMTFKVPLNARCASNGRLNDSTILGDSLFYHWVSRDPIATYLFSVVGGINYKTDILYYHKIPNPFDSIPVRLYYSQGENNSNVKNVILPMTTFYSQTFGEYPFEKIGFSSVPGFISPFCGGMENQTIINLFCSSWDDDLAAHEFAHQWFGDAVTCGTWADIWLNEGFATYCQALWKGYKGGYNSYKDMILNFSNNYLTNNPGWAMYNPSWAINVPGGDTLFYYATTYAKGACVLHMLRYTLGDSLFFGSLKAYQADTNFKYKSAVTDNFTAKVSQVSGQDISWFINEWVKQPNHPVYNNTYNINKAGNGIYNVSFTAMQVQTNSPFHKMPVLLKILFYTGPDSNISVMNDFNGQTWDWSFYGHPREVQFDPNNDIVLKVASTNPGPNSETQYPATFSLYQNYPNPFNPATNIDYDVPANAQVTIKLYNVIGQLVALILNEQILTGRYTLTFDGTNLASGIYFYEMTAKSATISFTAVKKMVILK